jgi:hypothetical protein
MVEREYIKNQLAVTKCYNCSASLDGSTFALLNNTMPLVTIGHAVCGKCQSQNMVTLTMGGNSAVPMESDLISEEIVKYADMQEISYTELLDLHQALKKESLCRLLHKSEKNSVKKIRI